MDFHDTDLLKINPNMVKSPKFLKEMFYELIKFNSAINNMTFRYNIINLFSDFIFDFTHQWKP